MLEKPRPGRGGRGPFPRQVGARGGRAARAHRTFQWGEFLMYSRNKSFARHMI